LSNGTLIQAKPYLAQQSAPGWQQAAPSVQQLSLQEQSPPLQSVHLQSVQLQSVHEQPVVAFAVLV